MIIWGSGGKHKELGAMETKHCSTCEKERAFKLHLQYRFAHLYYLFAWVTEKHYVVACDVCHCGQELSAKDVEQKLENHPIPFLHRFGWLFLVAIIASFIISAATK